MTIHDLENLESSKDFDMRELLSAYVTHSNGGMVSLHNFMATDPNFKAKVQPSKALMDKSYEILDQMRMLFPATDEPRATISDS
jgi:hypothetical protein